MDRYKSEVLNEDEAAKSGARPDAAKLLADLVERTVTKVRQAPAS